MARKPRRIGKIRPFKVVRAPAQPFSQHPFGGRVEFLRDSVPTVFMTREVYSRMWHFVDIAAEEVSWYGTVRITPYGNYLIDEVFLPKQEVSATQTEISTEGLALLGQDLIDNRPNGVETANRLRFWGHSHVNMGTSPSPQDDTQMGKFSEDGCQWFIRGILNKLGRMEFTIYLWEAGVKIADAPWAIYEHVDESMRAGIEAEFKAKVSKKVYVYTPPVPMIAGPNGVRKAGTGGHIDLRRQLASLDDGGDGIDYVS